MRHFLSATLLATAAFLPGAEGFRDPTLPRAERVRDLLGRLTVEEKVGLLRMDSQVVQRLGIPAYHWWSEGLHGIARNGTATVFPQAIGLAATWDPALMQQVGDVVSTEARAKYRQATEAQQGATNIYQGLTIWSPNINIMRDPRWGRAHETYGEDPFLTGRLAIGFVRGLQGDDPKYLKTAATLKHFAVHSGPEPLRHGFDAQVSAADLWQTYLPAFAAGIQEGKAASVMSAYNAINGTPAPAHAQLLTLFLRGRWGFDGAVVGDVDNVADIWNPKGHRMAADRTEASAVAILAGNDLCSGSTYDALPKALKQGLVQVADLDRALTRVLDVRFRLGQFDPAEQVRWAAIPTSAVDTPEHDTLALQAARRSVTLLKNDGALPWKLDGVKSVAIIGPTADLGSCVLGNYAGRPSHPVRILAGLKAKLEAKGIVVVHEPGVPLVEGFREGAIDLPEGWVTSGGQPGFTADQRRDRSLDFTWNPYEPIPGLPLEGGHITWTGDLAAQPNVAADLSVTVQGKIRIFTGDRLLLEGGDSEKRSTISKPIDLSAAQTLRIEMVTGRSNFLRLGVRLGRGSDALERAIVAAKSADRILLTLGISPDLEGEEMHVTYPGFAGGDRTSIALPATQQDLLARVVALGKPVTVVLTGGGCVDFDADHVNAALMAWYYGQRGGEAVAEVLLGEQQPGGRLPLTWYRSADDLPPFASYAMAGRTYRYFTGTPRYPFGHGLTYGNVEFTAAALDKATADAKQTVTLTTTLRNPGVAPVEEVVQVYATREDAGPAHARRTLVGFARATVPAGQTVPVAIDLPVERVAAAWSDQANAVVAKPGTITLEVGRSSADPRQRVTLAVTAKP